MTIITIHEFSTGIAVQGTPENWWSTRFTGYMNLTLAKVPAVLQNAISNRLFQVAEGSVREAVETARAAGETTVQPAIIVREVKEGNHACSAIAVITPAKDEKGRTISVYRYFLTTGLGNLTHLLYWYDQKAKKLIFDPFDIKNEGDYYEYDTSQTRRFEIPRSNEKLQNLLNSDDANIIISYDIQCMIYNINKLASIKKEEYELTAWAYKVEGLSKPWFFQAIYPASRRAEETIKKQIQQGENIAPIVEGEYPVKTAIRTLSNQAGVKYDLLNHIEEALKLTNHYNDKTWEDSIFKTLDIENAKKADFNTPYFIRLYELYGLNIYQKLPDLLKWLELDAISKSNDLEQEHYKIAAELSRKIQEQIKQSPDSFKAIELKAFQGINYIISSLALKESVEGINFTQETRKNLLKNWLTLDNDGLWRTVYQKYYRQLWNDIVQIAKNYMTARNTLIEAYSQPKYSNISLSESHIKKMLEDEIPQSGSSNNKQQEMILSQGTSTFNYIQTNTNNDSHPKDSYELRYAYQNLQILGQDNWKSITDDMVKLIWYGRSPQNSKYSYLADFFGEVGELFEDRNNYFLSALFHTMATGEVPTSIWNKCKFQAKYEKKYKFIKIPDSPTIELSRRLALWEKTIISIIKLLIKFYQFWSQPYTPKEDEKKTGKVVLLRYLIIFVLTIILIDGLKFSPIKIGQDAFKISKNWVDRQLDPDSALTKEDKEQYMSTTVPALDKIVNDFVKYSKPREKVNRENFNRNTVEQAIIKILQNPESDFQLAFFTKNATGEKSKWFTAIKEYQTRVSSDDTPTNLKADGIIKTGENTDQRLRCDIVNELKLEFDQKKVTQCNQYGVDLTNQQQILPTDSTEVQNWNKNLESLNALVTEFKTKHTITYETSLNNQISELLTQRNKDYDQINQIDPTNINSDRKVWLEGIKTYQKSKGATKPDGLIDKDGATYNHLKCDIAKGLGIILNNPPNQCK